MKIAPPARSRAVSVLALGIVAFLLAAAFPPVGHATVPGSFGPPRLGLFWTPIPTRPCDGDSVRLRFDLCRCDVEILGAEIDSEQVVVRVRAHPGIVCVRCVPDSAEVPIGRVAAGQHAFSVRIDIEYAAPPDTTWPATPFYDILEFAVGAGDCGPNPGTVRYLDSVVVDPPACAGDSITLHLAGTFPTSCVRLSAVENLGRQIPGANVLDTVRLIYANSCAPCAAVPVPWFAQVRVGPAPSGGLYSIPVVAYERDLCAPDTSGVQFAGSLFAPVSISEICPPPQDGCFNVSWHDSLPGPCDAFYGPNRDAQLDFRVGSTVPVAGVQGTLRLETDALHIVAVAPGRDGWAVQTSPDPAGGVRFVAFATSPGAAIPGQADGRPQPLLRVRVAPQVPGDALPEYAHLAALDLLVSGSAGQSILPCPIPFRDPPPSIAVLCREGRCDANADGSSDVRDLVLMVNCLEQSSGIACPLERMDCDADGGIDLDDVSCCARHMLGGDPPSTPPDSARVTPDLALRFGAPVAKDGTLEVPLVLEGVSASGVAAARVDVAYPDDRYEIAGLTLRPPHASWWLLSEVEGGTLRLALLDLSGAAPTPVPLTGNDLVADQAEIRILLRERRGGGDTAGEIAVTAGDFSARDGVALTTPNANARLALAAPGRVALSAPGPNPFGASTSLALTVPTAGAVDVGVFDVAGRRVATLLRDSNAAPGVYPLRWDGTDDARGRAVGGVYFVRVLTGAGEASRKLLFLPGTGR